MTNSRTFWAAALWLTAAAAGAQSMPTEAAWAVAELAGSSGWAARLPLMIARNWGDPGVHRLSDGEKTALRRTFLDQSRTAALRAVSTARLGLAKKQLAGTAGAADETAARKSAAEAQVKADDAQAGRTAGAAPPESLPLKARWSGTPGEKPWPAGEGSLAAVRANAAFVLTGKVDDLGPALAVHLVLECDWTRSPAAVWDGVFAPDEAEAQMAVAAAALLRGLVGTGPDEGVPAPPPAPAAPAPDRLVLDTDPPGAQLYLDSRYLGTAPQTVDRPTSIRRVRAEAADGGSRTWEIGPSTPSPEVLVFGPPPAARDVAGDKDRFYWSLAAFSAGLTATAFASAWSSEQLALTQAYYDAGSASGYDTAYQRYVGVTALYGGSVVLTSALFVWMMFELGDYLGSAQASLP